MVVVGNDTGEVKRADQGDKNAVIGSGRHRPPFDSSWRKESTRARVDEVDSEPAHKRQRVGVWDEPHQPHVHRPHTASPWTTKPTQHPTKREEGEEEKKEG